MEVVVVVLVLVVVVVVFILLLLGIENSTNVVLFTYKCLLQILTDSKIMNLQKID